MKSLKNFFTTYYLPIVAGIFIGTSYIPFPPWASFFAFVPLWIFFHRAVSLKQILIGGWIAQFTFTLIGFNWVALTVHEFGHMPWPVAVITLLLFCAVANLDVPLSGLLWFWARRKWNLSPQTGLIFLALITALLEALVPTLFPWNYGYTLYWSGLSAAQLGELIGFQGLSSLVILTNILTFKIWQKRKSSKVFLKLAVLVVWLGLLSGGGWLLKSKLIPPDRSTSVLIAQANIGNLEKQYAEYGYAFRQSITSRYVSLTEEALAQIESVDLIVWPETAFPYEMDMRGKTYGEKVLSDKVSQWKTSLITGGYGYGTSDEEPDKVSNTFFIVEDKSGLQQKPYFKTHLLAFGEYIPGANFFPTLRKWIPAGDFARGSGPAVKSVGSLKIGPQICYESLFPDFSADLARQGAQIFVNLTNDSWYGTWQEPYQHLYMTLARAIEYRRPLVRATNTGISTVVLADGKVLEKSALNKALAMWFDVPYRETPPSTFYQLYPWLMNALLIMFTLVIIGRAYFGGKSN